jgi:hypothetical protein
MKKIPGRKTNGMDTTAKNFLFATPPPPPTHYVFYNVLGWY